MFASLDPNYREKDYEKRIDDTNLDEDTKKTLKMKLREQSSNNTKVYQDLYILENLFREFLKIKWFDFNALPSDCPEEVNNCFKQMKKTQVDREEDEEVHELKWKIVKENSPLNYIDFVYLWILVDFINKAKSWRYNKQTMEAHSKEIIPVRNPIMHTNEITDEVTQWGKIDRIIDYVDKLSN